MKVKVKKSNKNIRYRKDGKQLFWLEIPFEAVRDNRLTETARWVLSYIRFAQHDNEKAWPTIQTIAKMVGKSIPQVKKALKVLQETGWLERSYRTGPKGVSTSTVPSSSDWKKNGVYEVEDTASFALNKEEPMSSNSIAYDTIPRQDGIADDTQDSIADDTNMVSPTIHRKDKEKIIKNTTTQEVVFIKEGTEERKEQSTIRLSVENTDLTKDEKELLALVQQEYRAVFGGSYAPTKNDKDTLHQLVNYDLLDVRKVLEASLYERKKGRLPFFSLGIVQTRLEMSGFPANRSKYHLCQYGGGGRVEPLWDYRDKETGEMIILHFDELPIDQKANWQEVQDEYLKHKAEEEVNVSVKPFDLKSFIQCSLYGSCFDCRSFDECLEKWLANRR